MTPTQASRLAAHGRRLRAAKILTVHECAVFDTLLWRLRRPGRADFTADYTSIAKLAGVCRCLAIKAVVKLQEIGLLTKTCRRIKVRWGTNRTMEASRQIANAYWFKVPATESTGQAADKGIARSSILEAALAGLADATGLNIAVNRPSSKTPIWTTTASI